jgi:hypothetical protein
LHNACASRLDWFVGHLAMVIRHDIEQFMTVYGVVLLVKVFELIAARLGSLLVIADLAWTLEIKRA